ncbi:magnesium transporter CorA family protein [Enterococcus termitis]|uniref:Magnesium transporter CorA n=1 Tax=Enterococcus termitis TaxID=332950 RepID=A0A1E5H5V3_9ENTE|nr:magnesium transporter CorA family protein [Enterococcus termitis]OEG20293.1 magnesium transporter CorA [Enterococcus termitis]OJG97287.1 cation transporter [Enterococcus termitis]
MINYLALENGQFTSSNSTTEDTIWLAVERPSEEEINHLIDTYKLPKDYITGVLDDDENSRFEGLHQNTLEEPALLLVQYPHATISPSGYTQLDTFPFAVILTTDGKVITVINKSADFLKKALTTPFPNSELPIQESLILYLSWHISTCYNRFLKELIQETNKLEGELKVSTENSQLYQIMDIQKSLVYFESAINSNLEVLNRLYSAKIFSDPRAHLPHLHDILVETKQAATTTKIQLKLVDKISDTFSAIVSNNLNNVMKILTSLTIVLTIPTIIGGVFGMNVKLPFANREDAFFWISVVTTVTCIFVIYRLKKRNLL